MCSRSLLQRGRVTSRTLVVLCSLSTPAHAVIAPGPQGSAHADPSEWNSVLMLRAGAVSCSTTVIGPQVILTAANCVAGQRGEVAVSVVAAAGRIDYRMTCTTHPRFPEVAAADLALCKTNLPLPVARIERVNATAAPAGANVTLVGYGCRDRTIRNVDGRLSAGQATLLARAPGQSADGSATTQGAAACAGDGGGGAFLGDDSTSRSLVGVISRTDAVSRTTLALVATDAFLNWATEWSRAAAAPICGLSDDVVACTPRPQEAPAINPSAELPRDALVLARATSAPSVVANAQLGRASSNDVPLRQVFFRKGEVLAALVQISCYGTADEAYLARVLEHLERVGQPLASDHVFATSGTLTIPVCPPSRGKEIETIVVTVTKNSPKRLWDYFQRITANKAIGERWDFEYRGAPRIPPPGLNSRYFVDVFKELNPTQNPSALTMGDIVLPLRPRTITVVDEPAANIETLQPFDAIETADEKCAKRQDDLTYPFDLVGLLDALSANARGRSEPLTDSARIVVFDSGLYTSRREETVFRRALYIDRRNVDPSARTEFLSRIEPRLPKASDAAHGTHVASVALGGPLFARIQASSAEVPRIRIDPYRVKESRAGTVTLPADKIPDIFRDLNPRGVAIINVSFGATTSLSAVLDRLGDKGPNFIFVVAAGNSNNALGRPKAGGGGAVHHHFPASYGGPDNEGQANLIAVAALYKDDSLWRRAPFSDYGASYVELGAPGCSVPVLHFDRTAEAWVPAPLRENGTSFAAPLVSFTAALVSSERPDAPASQIKSRILAAADLDPTLIEEIADGRRLNVVKAAAVSQDVMQTTSQILLGTMQLHSVATGAQLMPTDALPIRCAEGPPDGLRLSEVVKIVPGFNRDTQSPLGAQFPDRVYALRGAKRQLRQFSCAVTEELAVHFQREGTLGMPAYGWEEIRDLVPRMP